MTDTDRLAHKKPARPNLFAPKEATRMVDERISVLASLDANPPPKKKARKKKALSSGTIVMLTVTAVLITGTIYVLAIQAPAADSTDADQATAHTVTAAPALAAQEKAPDTSDDASRISLSTLSDSAPLADATSAPLETGQPLGSAIIENAPLEEPRSPVAVLESAPEARPANPHDTSAKTKSKAAANPLEVLKHADGRNSKHNRVREPSSKRPAPVAKARQPEAASRSTTPRPAQVDTDVVLLEALVTSSDRQKVRDSGGKSKDKGKPLATEAPGTHAHPEPPEKAVP